MASALAINIGVTGHKDIPIEDLGILEQAVRQELKSLLDKYPHSSFNVLSGLAEGADQLVANVALSLNINVIAVLPFAQAEYEKDFKTAAALQDFKNLLSQCKETKTCQIQAEAIRDEGYIELGKTLVRSSDIMLALWDGVMHESINDNSSDFPGGTADVVKMCVHGLVDDVSLLFSKPNKTHCKWLVTNRQRHIELPTSIGEKQQIGSWKPMPIAGNQDAKILREILSKTEQFNIDALSITESERNNSIAYLLGSEEKKAQYPAIKTLIDVYSVADCLAQSRQKQRLTSLNVITWLSFLAIISQQIYAGLHTTLGWFMLHIILVFIVVIIYRVFFAGSDSKEEQFVEWRVFAEDLRVQIFWHIAGISEHCADNYRTTKLYEMDWIVDNLNKLMLNLPEPKNCDIEFVRNEWIIDQRNYFYGQRGERGRAAQLLIKHKKFRQYSIALFGLAIGLMFLSIAKVEFAILPELDNQVLFVYIALAFTSSALIKTFSAQMGFEELSQRYLRTGYFFQQAMNRMALIDKKNLQTPHQSNNLTKRYQNVIKTIGIEALNENAAWLQLHKMNAYQVQVT